MPEERVNSLSNDVEQMRVRIAMRSRIRTAAIKAKKLYPGPVGELIHRELTSWEEVGAYFGGRALMHHLVEYIENEHLPVLTPSRIDPVSNSGTASPA